VTAASNNHNSSKHSSDLGSAQESSGPSSSTGKGNRGFDSSLSQNTRIRNKVNQVQKQINDSQTQQAANAKVTQIKIHDQPRKISSKITKFTESTEKTPSNPVVPSETIKSKPFETGVPNV